MIKQSVDIYVTENQQDEVSNTLTAYSLELLEGLDKLKKLFTL
jgi:hypothetical protein